MTADQYRFKQLYNAALNLGMKAEHAEFYARDALAKEKEHGEWNVVPRSAEALANDCP